MKSLLHAATMLQNLLGATADVLIVNSTDGDYANARYFSNFWPLFERSGVLMLPMAMLHHGRSGK